MFLLKNASNITLTHNSDLVYRVNVYVGNSYVVQTCIHVSVCFCVYLFIIFVNRCAFHCVSDPLPLYFMILYTYIDDSFTSVPHGCTERFLPRKRNTHTHSYTCTQIPSKHPFQTMVNKIYEGGL